MRISPEPPRVATANTAASTVSQSTATAVAVGDAAAAVEFKHAEIPIGLHSSLTPKGIEFYSEV